MNEFQFQILRTQMGRWVDVRANRKKVSNIGKRRN